MLDVAIMFTTVFRYVVAVTVLVNLSSAVLCIDTGCAAEMTNRSDRHETDACSTDSGHGSEQDHATDDHCSSCPQCSVSVIILDRHERQHFVTRSIPPGSLIEDIRTGWVSLPERPPSA